MKTKVASAAGHEDRQDHEQQHHVPAVAGLGKISLASTLATMNQGESGTGRMSARTSTPR